MIEFIIAILLITIVALVARIQDLQRKCSQSHRHAVEVGNANARLMVERGEIAIELHRLNEPAVCPKCKSPYWNRPRRQVVAAAKISQASAVKASK